MAAAGALIVACVGANYAMPHFVCPLCVLLGGRACITAVCQPRVRCAKGTLWVGQKLFLFPTLLRCESEILPDHF